MLIDIVTGGSPCQVNSCVYILGFQTLKIGGVGAPIYALWIRFSGCAEYTPYI